MNIKLTCLSVALGSLLAAGTALAGGGLKSSSNTLSSCKSPEQCVGLIFINGSLDKSMTFNVSVTDKPTCDSVEVTAGQPLKANSFYPDTEKCKPTDPSTGIITGISVDAMGVTSVDCLPLPEGSAYASPLKHMYSVTYSTINPDKPNCTITQISLK